MEITAQIREKVDKGSNRKARETGFLLAELYGHGIANLHLLLNAKEFGKAFKEAGETTIIQVVLGKEKRPVLVHDIQRDPLTRDIRHIDLYQVRMDEKTTSHVPLVFVGEAPAVKEKKGTLNKTMAELEVEALPADLPHTIEVPLASLVEVGVSIHVQDLKISPKVKILEDGEAVIATVVPLAEEEVVQTGPTTLEEVQVESELKKAEREKEKEEKE